MQILEEKIVGILDKFEGLSEDIAPRVIESTISAVQYSSLSSLTSGAIALVLTAASYFVTRKVWYTWDKKEGDGFATFLLSLLTALFGVIAVSKLASVWNWVGLFDPMAVLAKTWLL